MEKIGEYKDFSVCLFIVKRVQVFKLRSGRLVVWKDYFKRKLFSFENGLSIKDPNMHICPKTGYLFTNCLPDCNDPAQIITDPAQWVLGKNKSKPIKHS